MTLAYAWLSGYGKKRIYCGPFSGYNGDVGETLRHRGTNKVSRRVNPPVLGHSFFPDPFSLPQIYLFVFHHGKQDRVEEVWISLN